MTQRPAFSQWRKIAMATWRPRQDGMIYASFDIDAEAALAYVQEARAATGEHVTMCHLTGRAVGRVLEAVPGLNGRIVGGVFMPSPTIDVFFTVSLRADVESEGEAAMATDLSGTVVRRVDEKPPWVIAHELADRARRIRNDEDPQFKRTKELTRLMPVPLLRAFLSVSTFVTEDLQLPIPPLGLEARPFGSFLVTNVGTFGLDRAFAPLPTLAHLPGLVVVGSVRDAPVVVDGEVVVRKVLPLAASIDHRFIDGYQGALIASLMREYLEDPARFDPLPAPPKPKANGRRRPRKAVAAA